MITLGMVEHWCKLEEACKGKTGLELVHAKLQALNYAHCWIKGKGLWPIVNRMLWRFHAMYEGGDVFLAGMGGRPHDTLWTKDLGKSPFIRHRNT